MLAVPQLLGGCSPSAPEHFAEATRLLAAGKRDAAVVQLRNAVNANPSNSDAHLLLGKSLLALGDLPAAETALRKALDLGASDAKALPLLARALLERENYEVVLAEFDIQPGFDSVTRTELALIRAQALMATGALTEARKTYEFVQTLQPASRLLGLAKAALLEGNFDTARTLIAEAQDKWPDNSEAWLLKGDLLNLQANPAEALAAYQQSVSLQSENVPALLAQVVLQINSGDLPAARAAMSKASRVSPASPNVAYVRALLQFQEKKFSECGESLRRVLSVIPGHMPSLLLSGVLSVSTGAFEQAQLYFGRYLSKFPGSIAARKLLAEAQLRNHQPQNAIYVLQPLLDAGIKDSHLLMLAAQANIQLGKLETGITQLETSVALDPKNAQKRSVLAASRLFAGDIERSLSDIESALQLDGGNSRALQLRVLALIGRNQLEQALEVVKSMETSTPNDPLVHNLNSAVHLARKDFPQARRSLERALRINPAYFPAVAALAQIHLSEGDHASARNRLTGFLQQNRNSIEATIALAGLAFGNGETDEALGWLNQGAQNHPRNAQVQVLLARLHLQKGQPKLALEHGARARKLNPVDPQALEVTGTAQMELGDFNAAVVSYTTLTEMLPESISAMIRLGKAYLGNGDLRSAAMTIEKTLNADGENLEAQLVMAEIHLRTGRYGQVLTLARRLQANRPEIAHGYVLEADAYWAQRDYARAAQVYERALLKQGTGRLAIRAHQARRFSGAATSDKALLDWLAVRPADVEVMHYLARWHVESGRDKEAIAQYRTLLRYMPNDVVALNSLAWLQQDDAPAQAVQVAEHAYSLAPQDPAIIDTLGWLLVKNKQLTRGTTLLRKASELAPENPGIRFRYAKALFENSEFPLAVQELERLLGAQKPFPQRAEATALLERLRNKQ